MNEHEVDSYKKAGRIAGEIKSFMRSYIKEGMLLNDIALKVDELIKEKGAEPAFPVGLSVDDVAAHFTPMSADKDVVKGLLKFDIGVCVDGYIADTAMSLDFTKDNAHKDLIDLNEQVAQKIIKTVKPGMQVKEIGEAVESMVEEYNEKNNPKVSILKGLSGHQIARDVIHAGLTIPNYRNGNTREYSNMAIAVEPFLTTGNGKIYEGKGGGIYIIRSSDRPRDNDARKVLEYIKENYKTRPFCMRWLETAGFTKLRFILSTLERQGIIYHYPILMEESGKPVSQIENTFVSLGDSDEVLVTTLESS